MQDPQSLSARRPYRKKKQLKAPALPSKLSPQDTPMVSVVVPIYNEEENIKAFHATLLSVLEDVPGSGEIFYVKEGSRDACFPLLPEIQGNDPRGRVVVFSGNLGPRPPPGAVLQPARGVAFLLLVGFSQDPPQVLPALL